MFKNAHDRSFDEELEEYSLDPVEQAEEAEESIQSQSTVKRGRPAIPEKWTQVISMEHHDLENLKTHIIATDLLLAEGYQAQPPSLQEEEWRPYFFSKAFVKENKDIELDAFALE